MKKLTPQDILPMETYGLQRKDIRQRMSVFKAQRRIHVGPYASVMFEHYDTLWYQVHEMLYVEKAGFEQIQDEIDAYAALMPEPGVMTFTLMFEVDNPERRLAFLRELTGVEKTIFLQWEGGKTQAKPVDDQERTREADGKTSAVHFMKFVLNRDQVKGFQHHDGPVSFSIEHPGYAHVSMLPESLKAALQKEIGG